MGGLLCLDCVGYYSAERVKISSTINPVERFAPLMCNRKDDNRISFDSIMDTIWKSMKKASVLLLGYFGIEFWGGMYGMDGVVNVGFEVITEVCLLKIIILSSLFDFESCTFKNFEFHYQILAQRSKHLPCRYDRHQVDPGSHRSMLALSHCQGHPSSERDGR